MRLTRTFVKSSINQLFFIFVTTLMTLKKYYKTSAIKYKSDNEDANRSYGHQVKQAPNVRHFHVLLLCAIFK